MILGLAQNHLCRGHPGPRVGQKGKPHRGFLLSDSEFGCLPSARMPGLRHKLPAGPPEDEVRCARAQSVLSYHMRAHGIFRAEQHRHIDCTLRKEGCSLYESDTTKRTDRHTKTQRQDFQRLTKCAEPRGALDVLRKRYIFCRCRTAILRGAL